ncbi:DUF2382 domain-containing protein [Alkalilimnicola ehrlichii]|uniref:DUF2382 domain-containing protein n=1 Tax=Alkalilimnicola ehrlichii TaxID=351052 RepID=A0A3E0WWX7_9GAMM|nr:DUF2382 domain-containing protein [Alkalilimnicola ehrlichii]RFA36516.1 hypothetical protein CAL65_11145 [Alkalilimnicola ehrlichii]
MAKTVVGSFDNYQEAQSVVEELAQAGFDHDNISIMAKDQERRDREGSEAGGDTSDVAPAQARAPLAGGGLGRGGRRNCRCRTRDRASTGCRSARDALAGAGIGAAAGGAIGALTKLGVGEEDAHAYAENIRRGGAVVVVDATDADAEQAAGIMHNHGAIDIDRRREQWQQSGWQGFDENAEPYEAEQEQVIPAVNEELEVGKREVESGRARVYVRSTEEPAHEEIKLREDDLHVERRPVDRPASERDLEASRDQSMEFRETKEEPVVQKTPRVTEEVRVGKESRERTEEIDDTVRRTDVEIDDEEHRQGQPPRHPDEPGRPLNP